MTIGPWGIYDVLILLRSLCAIAHLNGIVPRVSNKGVFKGGFKPPPPPKFSDFFLKSEGKEIER